jgi:DNA-binding transcriptional regulator GbsR (MarR family)
MAAKPALPRTHEFAGLDEALAAELPAFENFFKTFGFKRVHGRVWGLLVLAGQPLSSREIADELSLSQGATSTTLSELAEWGAIQSEFDAARRCHLHGPVGNTLSIVATVFRRREQVVIGRFKHSVQSMLAIVRERFGERDPRVFTLRSILSSLEIADAVLKLVFSSVERALGDSESLLSRAVRTALKVGMRAPHRKGLALPAARAADEEPELALPSGSLGDEEESEVA